MGVETGNEAGCDSKSGGFIGKFEGLDGVDGNEGKSARVSKRYRQVIRIGKS